MTFQDCANPDLHLKKELLLEYILFEKKHSGFAVLVLRRTQNFIVLGGEKHKVEYMYIFIWKLMNIRLHMYFVKIDYHHQHEISEPEVSPAKHPSKYVSRH